MLLSPIRNQYLHGHSKGCGQAIIVGERKGVDTITQDPALTPKMIATARRKHIINRTPTDYVSALSSIMFKMVKL
jgi:hypothetical protein